MLCVYTLVGLLCLCAGVCMCVCEGVAAFFSVMDKIQQRLPTLNQSAVVGQISFKQRISACMWLNLHMLCRSLYRNTKLFCAYLTKCAPLCAVCSYYNKPSLKSVAGQNIHAHTENRGKLILVLAPQISVANLAHRLNENVNVSYNIHAHAHLTSVRLAYLMS